MSEGVSSGWSVCIGEERALAKVVGPLSTAIVSPPRSSLGEELMVELCSDTPISDSTLLSSISLSRTRVPDSGILTMTVPGFSESCLLIEFSSLAGVVTSPVRLRADNSFVILLLAVS